jgi:hypothetical protein
MPQPGMKRWSALRSVELIRWRSPPAPRFKPICSREPEPLDVIGIEETYAAFGFGRA